jgi:hypothetical protein
MSARRAYVAASVLRSDSSGGTDDYPVRTIVAMLLCSEGSRHTTNRNPLWSADHNRLADADHERSLETPAAMCGPSAGGPASIGYTHAFRTGQPNRWHRRCLDDRVWCFAIDQPRAEHSTRALWLRALLHSSGQHTGVNLACSLVAWRAWGRNSRTRCSARRADPWTRRMFHAGATAGPRLHRL